MTIIEPICPCKINTRVRTKSGRLLSYCRSCQNERDRQWRVINRTKWLTQRKQSHYKTHFNLSQEDLKDMLIDQKGACPICGVILTFEKKGSTRAVVDHDHNCCPDNKTCGKCVRALLCVKCNSALGLLNDDPTSLRAAALYVEKYNVG